jgi:hypothetical protein
MNVEFINVKVQGQLGRNVSRYYLAMEVHYGSTELLITQRNVGGKRGKSCPFTYLTKHYAMKTYAGVDVYIHFFLTSTLVGGERSASHPYRFTPPPRRKIPRRHPFYRRLGETQRALVFLLNVMDT